MAISREDVEHVALLSRLELSEAEKEKFSRELSHIFEYAEQLNALDVAGVHPSAHALPMKNVFREDVARPSLDREKALANAPDKQDGCFKFPPIVQST